MADHFTHHSTTSTSGDFTPLVAHPGREVVLDLRAGAAPWDIGGGHTPLDGWSYNGTTPGPTIEARQGDILVARLTNHLDEPTTIHWHGLRLQPAMDGTEDVQKPVEPGATFEYRFALPDAGTFWYHPHIDETVQLERGLYGVLVVRGPEDPQVDGERVLVFDDVSLDGRGRLSKPGGREGQVLLLNGRVQPQFEIAAGHVERWRLLNASSARYVRCSLGGRSYRIIGTDGGLIEMPVEATEVLLAPADRVDLLVGPFAEGQAFEIQSIENDRSLGTKPTAVAFGTVRVGAPRPTAARIPERLRTIEPIATADVPPMREVRFGERINSRRSIDFLINDEPHHHGQPVRVGELQIWDLVNETPFDHPFHLHGFFFQVLSVNGEPPAYRSWEDTVNVPPGGRVRIAWMPDDRPGRWMAHCHILEHHAAGMMMHFEVVR
jgi:FtsP/CotA-like multicopper oxidase with cupredoxin domain